MDSREEIKSRMMKDIARAWNFQETEMDQHAFDPLVGLLVGALSVEFEKINQEINSSRERILERLISALTPDVLTGPVPAWAILNARPVEPEFIIRPTHQTYTKKKIEKAEKEIFFSPMDEYRLVDGALRYIATGTRVWRTDNVPYRETVTQSGSRECCLPPGQVWLGLELNPALQHLDGISFFFYWKNEPKLKSWLRQLPYSQWFMGDHALLFERGLQAQPQTLEGSPFEKEYSPTHHVRQHVTQSCADHYLTLRGFVGGKTPSLPAHKQPYPPSFESVFPIEDLSEMQDRLLWLRLELPQYVPQEALNNLECYINCVPVLNRRQYKKDFRLAEHLNILPLRCDEFFFDVQGVSSEQGRPYFENPLANIRKLEAGHYTLRNRGVGKMDYRATSHLLQHVLDTLRDESAAFSAYHSDFLNTKIKRLNAEITDLEQHVKDGEGQGEENPFLIAKPQKQDKDRLLSIEYWGTNGEEANGIPAGAMLDLFATAGFRRDSIRLVAPSIGGRNRKTATESFYEFKKALVTRDRIVTKEDIKTFCHSRLGNRITGVSIGKGFRASDLPDEGMLRSIEVQLQPAKGSAAAEPENWAELCRELEETLNGKSSGLLPIHVTING